MLWPLPSANVQLEGSVIAYVKPGAPETVNAAAATVPEVDGSVTPPLPPALRVLAVVSITDPPVPDATATLPKFISVSFAMVIGVITEAVAPALAIDWANPEVPQASNRVSVIVILFNVIMAVRS